MFMDDDMKKHFNNDMFYGFDFDYSMLRIASMNMMSHGHQNPNIDYQDSLSEDVSTLKEFCTCVIANPPFKGSVNEDTIAKNIISEVNTKKTELLFLALMIRILKTGGRACVIVPDGVLFGTSNAHTSIRKKLIDNQKLEAVISMPSGVFKPYAGVSTAILIFTKTNKGGTDKVWFYDMQNDGFTLNDNRTPIEENDIEGLPKESNLLFPNEAGNYQNPSNIRNRKWKPLLAYVGITKRVRIHDMRSTYINLSLSNDLGVKFAQKQAGHKKSQTTLDIYARCNNDMNKKAREVLNEIFTQRQRM